MSARQAKVEDGLRGVLAEALREIRDPRVKGKGLVGITRVECNADLSVARVYVSVFGQDPERTVAGLAAAAGFLRGPAGRKLNLARPPELRFFHDNRAQVGQQLGAIVRDDEARARAAAEAAAPPPAPGDDEDA